MRVDQIARLCHEVNRAYCFSLGDASQKEWSESPEWQQDSAINGVRFHLENDVTPEDSHYNWWKEKVAAGWIWGPDKDPETKQHPCMVPYNELPAEQRTKDYLFKAIVDTFKADGVEKEHYGNLENSLKLPGLAQDSDETWKKERYLQLLCEIQKSGHDVHYEINEVLVMLKPMYMGTENA